jgi:TonB family protein
MSFTALAISVRWGDRLISSQVLRPGARRVFQLGQSASADVTVPRAGTATFNLGSDGPDVHFTDGVRGQVFRNGDTALAMSDVIHRGLAQEADEGWTLPLGRRDGVVLEFGALKVEAWPTKAPSLAGRMSAALDYCWLNVLLATVLFAVVLVLRFELLVMEGGALEDDETSTPPRSRKWLVVAAKPEAPAPSIKDPSHERAKPEHARAAEGKPKPKPTPVTRGEGGPRAAVPNLRGLLEGLGGQGVLGHGGLSQELTRSLGNVVGVSDGLGGIGLRGTGGGGDLGGPLRIGGLARRFVPGGGPNVPLSRGEAVSPVLDPPPTDVDCTDGCLDRELIRRIVRGHVSQVRYCYEQLLPRMPTLEGRVVVKWHVTPAGRVDTSTVVSSTAQSPALGECLAGRVRTWVFPASKQVGPAGFTVSYPFIFKLASDGR